MPRKYFAFAILIPHLSPRKIYPSVCLAEFSAHFKLLRVLLMLELTKLRNSSENTYTIHIMRIGT